MKKFRYLLKTSSQSLIKGFTLVELLAAASLTSVVISSAGYALLNMLNLNMRSRADSTLAYNVNRSIDFISEEIKMAREVKPDAAVAVDEITDFSLPTDATPILVLTLSNGKNVVYYSQPARQPWGGDQVVKRWGPDFDENGNYDEDTLLTPSNWSHSVLIDYVSDGVADNDQCPVNWQMTHNDTTRGFYACVPTTGATTSLVQFGVVADAPHVVGSDSLYAAQTKALTRSSSMITGGINLERSGDDVIAEPVSDGNGNGDGNGTDGEDNSTPVVADSQVPNFGTDANVQDGKILIEVNATVTFTVLGTQITCDAYGDSIPVTAEIYITDAARSRTRITLSKDNPTKTVTVQGGSVIDILARARGGSCEHGSVVSTRRANEKLVALISGDDVPDIAPFADQASITSLVQPYVSNGRMTLASNEVIHLIELGTNNTSDEAFDLQDLILLTSITSTQVN